MFQPYLKVFKKNAINFSNMVQPEIPSSCPTERPGHVAHRQFSRHLGQLWRQLLCRHGAEASLEAAALVDPIVVHQEEPDKTKGLYNQPLHGDMDRHGI